MSGTVEALRRLARGQASAREIAGEAGWTPRTAGPKMRSLELQGFVRRVLIERPSARSDAKYEWVLTDKGRDFLSAESPHGTGRP